MLETMSNCWKQCQTVLQVTEDGQVSVLNFSPAPSTLKPDEEDTEEEDREMAGNHVKHREHCPRSVT